MLTLPRPASLAFESLWHGSPFWALPYFFCTAQRSGSSCTFPPQALESGSGISPRSPGCFWRRTVFSGEDPRARWVHRPWRAAAPGRSATTARRLWTTDVSILVSAGLCSLQFMNLYWYRQLPPTATEFTLIFSLIIFIIPSRKSSLAPIILPCTCIFDQFPYMDLISHCGHWAPIPLGHSPYSNLGLNTLDGEYCHTPLPPGHPSHPSQALTPTPGCPPHPKLGHGQLSRRLPS